MKEFRSWLRENGYRKIFKNKKKLREILLEMYKREKAADLCATEFVKIQEVHLNEEK